MDAKCKVSLGVGIFNALSELSHGERRDDLLQTLTRLGNLHPSPCREITLLRVQWSQLLEIDSLAVSSNAGRKCNARHMEPVQQLQC